MTVILTQDHDTLGMKGDVVDVKPGFGQNFLIPRQMAVVATPATRKRYAEERRQAAHKIEAAKGNAEKLAQRIDGTEVVIPVKTGDEGRLFGSVTTQQVADELATLGLRGRPTQAGDGRRPHDGRVHGHAPGPPRDHGRDQGQGRRGGVVAVASGRVAPCASGRVRAASRWLPALDAARPDRTPALWTSSDLTPRLPPPGPVRRGGSRVLREPHALGRRGTFPRPPPPTPMRRLTLLLALVALPAAAQTTADVVSWRVRADRAEPGAPARVVLDAEIAPGWRLYALGSPVGVPLAVTLDALPAGVRAGPLAQGEVREGYDAAFESAYPYFAERGRVVQRVEVGAGVRPGRYDVTGAVRYAVCDDRVCLPPTRTAFRVPLVVE